MRLHNKTVLATTKHMAHGVIKWTKSTLTLFITDPLAGIWAGIGTMRHTRLDVHRFGVIIITHGISHIITILFTILTAGVIEIRITDPAGTTGDTTIPTTDLGSIEHTILPLGTAG